MNWKTTTRIYRHGPGITYDTNFDSTSKRAYGEDRVLIKPIEAREWRTKLKEHVDLQTPLIAYTSKTEPAVLSGQISRTNSIGSPLYTFSVPSPGLGPNAMIDLFPGILTTWTSEEEAIFSELQDHLKFKLENESLGLLQGVFVAEMHKTIHLMKHPLDSISKLLKKCLKGLTDASTFAQASRVLLEFRFGVKPLLYDVERISGEFEKFCEEGWIKMLKVNHDTFSSTQVLQVGGNSDYQIGGSPVWNVNISGTIRVYSKFYLGGACLLSQRQVEAYYTARPWAPKYLYLKELNATFWELVKFSWLIDYFIQADQVGRTERMILSTTNYEFFRAKRERHAECKWYWEPNVPFVTENTVNAASGCDYVEVRRFPKFDIKPPDQIIQAPKPKQGVNVLALILSRLF